MNKKSNPLNIKFAPTIQAALAMMLVLGINILLFFGRKKFSLRADFLENNFIDFYQHVSNFSISCMIGSMVGFLWLMLGVPFRFVAALCIAIIFINSVYELWIPVLNTRDVVDAYYGIVGAATAFVILAIVKKYGLHPMVISNADDADGHDKL